MPAFRRILRDLHRACREGDVGAIQECMETDMSELDSPGFGGPPLVNRRGDHGRTALHFAAQNNHAEAVTILIDGGADVNVQDKRGWTPLHEAAHVSHEGICELLLASGASKDVRDKQGHTPRVVAQRNNADAAVLALLGDGAPSVAAVGGGSSLRHDGTMTCRCGHGLGQVRFPLDSTYYHAASCRWSCCNQAWNQSPGCS